MSRPLSTSVSDNMAELKTPSQNFLLYGKMLH